MKEKTKGRKRKFCFGEWGEFGDERCLYCEDEADCLNASGEK